MPRPAPPDLWSRLRAAWLQAHEEAPPEPPLAETGLRDMPPPRPIPSLVGAHLR
jgi:hypothetical protein